LGNSYSRTLSRGYSKNAKLTKGVRRGGKNGDWGRSGGAGEVKAPKSFHTGGQSPFAKGKHRKTGAERGLQKEESPTVNKRLKRVTEVPRGLVQKGGIKTW